MKLTDKQKQGQSIEILVEIDGQKIPGSLRLNQEDPFNPNIVSFITDKFLNFKRHESLKGIFTNGKVSLLKCLNNGPLSSSGEIRHGNVSFRYVCFGYEHITPEDQNIRRIDFSLEGIKESVFLRLQNDTYGTLLYPDESVLEAIAKTRPDHLKGDLVKGEAKVQYFSGNWEFIKDFETVLSDINIHRAMEIDYYEPEMKDKPYISINFKNDPTNLEDALDKMYQIQMFFTWIMGFVPAWKDIRVFTTSLEENEFLEVNTSRNWRKINLHPTWFGTLIDGAEYPEHLKMVMKKWLERNQDPKKREANRRYGKSFQGSISELDYEERLIMSANNFDFLPSADKPSKKSLPSNVVNIIQDTKKQIKSLRIEKSANDDLLTSFGYILKGIRLRDIMEHRADIVFEYYKNSGLKKDEIYSLIREAAKWRNRFTHGPNTRTNDFDLERDGEKALILLTTLKFIYGASELLLCGWDPDKAFRGLAPIHPIGDYTKKYKFL